MRRILQIRLAFALIALVIIGCAAPAAPASKPTVIIASPPSGSVYTVGEEVVIQSTATDPGGITNVALLVDNTIVREDPSPVTEGQAQFSLIQSWVAEGIGQHTLTVRATNALGVTSDSGILITVRDTSGNPSPPTVVAIATAVPIATFTPVSADGVQTDVPTSPAPTGPVTLPPPATNAPACVLNSQFVADVTIPDGTPFAPNAAFAKTWRVRNTGNCAWENFGLVFVSGTQMAANPIYPVPSTPPGATADLVVPMTAPASYGSYTGTWRMRSAGGELFGTNLTIVIAVPSPATAVPPTNTPPPTVAGCSGQPNDFSFTANTTTITAGQSVTLSWSAVNNASEVRLNGGEFSNDGVETPGNRVVSPGATTEYTLKATCNNSGQTREKSVTITVNAAVGDFEGDWFINFGTMDLVQTGSDVVGTYYQGFLNSNGTIEGTVTGNQLNGTWSINGLEGDFRLNLSGDGNRVTGNFPPGSGNTEWCGARPGHNFPNGCSFQGEWTSDYGDGDCPMTLVRKDNGVTGSYCIGNITSGTVSFEGGQAVLNGNYSNMFGVSNTLKFFLIGFDGEQFNGNFNGTTGWCGWRDGASAPSPCQKP